MAKSPLSLIAATPALPICITREAGGISILLVRTGDADAVAFASFQLVDGVGQGARATVTQRLTAPDHNRQMVVAGLNALFSSAPTAVEPSKLLNGLAATLLAKIEQVRQAAEARMGYAVGFTTTRAEA